MHHHQQKGSIKINQSFGQDAKADVILKYSADEARNLKSYGEIIVIFVGFESWCLCFDFFPIPQANSPSLSRSTKLWTLSEVNLTLLNPI